MRKFLAALMLLAAVTGGAACAPPETTERPETSQLPVEPAAPVEPSPPSAPATTVEMPTVNDQNLMLAMDELEGMGMTNIVPMPVDGHAFVANPANWIVLGQEPAAGTRLSTTDEVTLQVSKADEAESSWCGDGEC